MNGSKFWIISLDLDHSMSWFRCLFSLTSGHFHIWCPKIPTGLIYFSLTVFRPGGQVECLVVGSGGLVGGIFCTLFVPHILTRSQG